MQFDRLRRVHVSEQETVINWSASLIILRLKLYIKRVEFGFQMKNKHQQNTTPERSKKFAIESERK